MDYDKYVRVLIKIINHMLDNYYLFIIILRMDLNDLIESNPTLFRVIAVVGGLLIGYIIYIIQI